MKVQIPALALLLAAILAWNASAQILPEPAPDFRAVGKDGLTFDQAAYIAGLVARHQGYPGRDRYYSMERMTDEGLSKKDPFPGFFYFGLDQQSRVGASVNHLRVYYVSKMTGDVWQSLTPSPPECYRVSFSQLKTVQRQIMRKTGATFASEKVQRDGIGCATE